MGSLLYPTSGSNASNADELGKRFWQRVSVCFAHTLAFRCGRLARRIRLNRRQSTGPLPKCVRSVRRNGNKGVWRDPWKGACGTRCRLTIDGAIYLSKWQCDLHLGQYVVPATSRVQPRNGRVFFCVLRLGSPVRSRCFSSKLILHTASISLKLAFGTFCFVHGTHTQHGAIL